jgi:hypothetical protein
MSALRTLNLRDLFWLLTVIGLLLAWWADRSPLAAENDLLWHAMTTGEAVIIHDDLVVAPRCSDR